VPPIRTVLEAVDSNLYQIVSETTISVQSELTPMEANGCLNSSYTNTSMCIYYSNLNHITN